MAGAGSVGGRVLKHIRARFPGVRAHRIKSLLERHDVNVTPDVIELFFAAHLGLLPTVKPEPTDAEWQRAEPRFHEAISHTRRTEVVRGPVTSSFPALRFPPDQASTAPWENGPAGSEPARSHAGSGEPCRGHLVILAAPSGGAGRLVRISGADFEIGRSASNALVLHDDPHVSRVHAVIRQASGRHLIEDLGSRHGTRVNGQDVTTPLALTHGDRIQLGQTTLLYLNGENTDEAYHEAIFSLRRRDPVTGAATEAVLEDDLTVEVARSVRHQNPLSLLVLSIDHFGELVDLHGPTLGDAILRETFRRISSGSDVGETIARRQDGFWVLLRECSAERADLRGQAVQTAIASTPFPFDEQRISVTASIGIASLSASVVSAQDLREVAEANLRRARLYGGNRVFAGSRAVEGRGRMIPGDILIHHALGYEPPRALVAFEMGNELSLTASSSGEDRASRFAELLADVESATRTGDLFGPLRERYVLLAPISTASAREQIRQVRSAWAARAPGNEAPRSLRHSFMAPDEIAALGMKALSVLLDRLLEHRDTVSAGAELPFPFAGPAALVSTYHGTSRFDAARFALERALQFLGVLACATLRASGDVETVAAMARCTANFPAPVSMGGWEDMAWHLARLVREPRGHPVFLAMTRALGANGRRSALAERIRNAIGLRNDMAHGPARGRTAVEANARELEETVSEFLSAMRPLRGLRLVSPEGVREQRRDGSVLYTLRQHQGPSELFPLVNEVLNTPLYDLSWGHLMGPSLSTPLSLAPWLWCGECPHCGRVEVFISADLVCRPPGVEVRLFGVTTRHETTAVVPDAPEIAAAASYAEAMRDQRRR